MDSDVTHKRFRALVGETLESLPASIREKVRNLEIIVEEWPTIEELEAQGLDPELDTLYGLYEGVALPEREYNFGMELPDRVTVFYGPLVEDFKTEQELREQIRVTMVHELAHFFGMDDNEIGDLGYG